MAAIGYLGATQQNADTAGLTSPEPQVIIGTHGVPMRVEALGRAAPDEAQMAAHTATTAAHGLFSPLDELVSGGIHPEGLGIVNSIGTDLVRATDSVRGPLGGLIPKPGSTVAPGPGGGVAEAKSTLQKALHRIGL